MKYISHQGIPSAPFLTSFASDVLGTADIQVSRSRNFAEVRHIRYVHNKDKAKEKKLKFICYLLGWIKLCWFQMSGKSVFFEFSLML